MVTTKKVKRLGIYCRVSSKKQMDNTSLENQKDRGIDFCNENDFQYEIYSDVISGNKVNRDGLNELYEKIYDGSLDGIILYEWDRLIRENRELMIQFEKLVEDTDCVVVVDNRIRDIKDNLSDRIEYEFKNTMSTIERIRLKKRVSEGIVRKMEKGDVLFGGVKKFGYMNVGKKMNEITIVDEDKRHIVEDLFRVFLLPSTTNFKICMDKWNHTHNLLWKTFMIKKTLKWEGYKGLVYQKWGGRKYPIKIPSIISEDIFNETQKKIKKLEMKRRGRDTIPHILKGLIECGDCGGRLYKKGKKQNEYYQQWYQCKWYKKPQYEKDIIRWENGEKCDKSYKGNYINKDFLDVFVWDMLFKFLRNSKDLRKEYENKLEKGIKNKQSTKYKLDYYKKNISDFETKKFELYNDYQSKKIKKKDYELYNKKYDEGILNEENRMNEVSIQYEKMSDIKKIDFDTIDKMMVKDLETKHKSLTLKDKEKLIRKYIERISIKRLDNEKYNIKFDVNLVLMEGVDVDVKDINYKTYIKNRKLWR
ncbi:MAG: recombinase family protein [Pelagibacterales bacterium]|nr:recombinase family protein [Pelagibacterales bacterium]